DNLGEAPPWAAPPASAESLFAVAILLFASRLGMLVDEGLDDFLGRQDRFLKLLLRDFLAVSESQRAFQGELAHPLCFLGHRRLQRAALNRLQSRNVTIKPNN